MRKIYFNTLTKDSNRWDGIWGASSLSDSLQNCKVDYMIPIFDRYFPRNGKILEGGCGLGKYVIYYKNKGYDIEGVDFSSKAINSILAFDKNIPVKLADVTKLPYPDNYFKCYFSGGVIEHFEDGPYAALKEARRVLEKNGLFIVLLPQINITKKFIDTVHFIALKKRIRFASELVDSYEYVAYLLVDRFEKTSPPEKTFSFHQYTFTKEEAEKIIKGSGFIVDNIGEVGIEYGLMGYKFLRDVYKRFKNFGDKYKTGRDGLLPGHSGRSIITGNLSELYKKIFVSENTEDIFTKPIVWLLRKSFANLLLFICRKS